MQILHSLSVRQIVCLCSNNTDLHIGQLLHDFRGSRTRFKYTKVWIKIPIFAGAYGGKYFYKNALSMPS